MTMSPLERAAAAFADELARWRLERSLTKRQLATQMGFDPSYVSHVESRRHRPTAGFARRAEMVLHAGGAIWHRFTEYDHARSQPEPYRNKHLPDRWLPPGTGLVIDQEIATLRQDGDRYRCTVRQDLYNAQVDPVTRYPVRIGVDRYPGDPERSRRYYRDHPVSMAALGLTARCGEEPMRWRLNADWDSVKEAWLLFENDAGRFPLYPGRRTTIEYEYRLDADSLGFWFHRTVRVPTRRLVVRLDFPAGAHARVWGTETTLTADAAPLRTPVTQRRAGDRELFEWATDDPPLHARYRLEWRFRRSTGAGAPGGESTARATTASAAASDSAAMARALTAAILTTGGDPGTAGAGHDLVELGRGGGRDAGAGRLRAAGIRQLGDPALDLPVDLFRLPDEAGATRDVLRQLADAVRRIAALGRRHNEGGVGLSAPQIGIGRAAVVLLPAGATQPVTLVNPRIVAAAPEMVERYEQCPSFPGLRGLVPRPRWLEVEHATPEGRRMVTRFLHDLARLAAHEVDHLEGRLYTARMAPGENLVPTVRYPETGSPWLSR